MKSALDTGLKAANAPIEWATIADGIVYTAQIPMKADGSIETGDIATQTELTLGNLRQTVEAAGGSMADIVTVTIFVTDITQREKVWQARREFFSGNFPASTLVQVAALATPALKVEINAVAHIGAGHR
jgi:enamine deaminase RidA (YjgF/YER057c/UK114 family)